MYDVLIIGGGVTGSAIARELSRYDLKTALFEKGEDVAGRMLSLLPQLNEVRNQGTPDMEFAVSGLLARSQLASGQPADARRTIEVLREYFAERGLTRFLPNIAAPVLPDELIPIPDDLTVRRICFHATLTRRTRGTGKKPRGSRRT